MTDILGELFGSAKPRSAPPSAPATQRQAVDPTGFDVFGDDNYGMTAITEMAHEMRNAVEGGRDKLLNNLCLKAGGIIRDGHLTRETAEKYLRAAAMEVSDASFDEWQIDEKLDRVIEEGMEGDYQRVPRDEPTFADVPADATPEQRATLAELAQMAHRRQVVRELETLRARDEAKMLFAAEKAEREFRVPAYCRTLTEELLLPREATRFAVADLLPMGGNALLTAQFKAGKTTFCSELARSWVDSQPFLGKFQIAGTRRVALFNYELSQQQYDDWLERSGITNTDAVSVLHLRGYRMPLTAKKVEDWTAAWLKDHDIGLWVLDPFARAAVGVDENSNTEVGVWLDTVDVIKERAGVSEAVLPTHTGRATQEAGQERARGATRLDDWADVRWILTRDDEGDRYFRATGRDVEFDEEKLIFDNDTRRLTIGGGNRFWVAAKRVEDSVVEYVRINPGVNARAVAAGVGGDKTAVSRALSSAVVHHRLQQRQGRGVEKLFYQAGLAPSLDSDRDPFKD